MYEKVVMDEEYVACMKKIDTIHFITDGKWDWEHGMAHAVRVSHYIRQFLTDLGECAELIECGRVAGLLHDIGLIDGVKEGHAKKSAEKARIYLEKFSLKPEMKKIIIQAIEDHSGGKNIQSSIGAALYLADKLDMAYHRVMDSTIKDSVNMEFLKVKKVELELTEKELYIDYQTEPDFDMQILNCWKKSILAPLQVSKYFDRHCIFMKNHKFIEVENILGEKI